MLMCGQLPALLVQTPFVRRCDLFSAMFGQHLRNCYLFADTGEAFLRQLAVALDYTTFFPGMEYETFLLFTKNILRFSLSELKFIYRIYVREYFGNTKTHNSTYTNNMHI